MKTIRHIGKEIVLIVFILTFNFSLSQDYIKGFGVRAGGYAAYYAVTYKEFFTQKIALETVLGSNTGKENKNTSLQLLVTYNQSFRNCRQLSFYAGGGPSLMYWYRGFGYVNPRTNYVDNPTRYQMAINPIVGLELQLGNLPLRISLDGGPSVILFPYKQVNFMLNGSFKYTIKKSKYVARYSRFTNSYRY